MSNTKSNTKLTEDQLKQIMPNAPSSKRAASLPILNAVMLAYEINNERRAAAWLATVAVESGELKYQEEIASGAAYENRRDLGNTQPGDGRRFKGHGRIQITGRANHTSYTHYLKGSGHLPFVDFIKEPHRLAEEPYATDSAGWFWAVLHDLNALADRRNFLETQLVVNGGRKRNPPRPNHWTERKAYYERGLGVLPDDFLLEGAVSIEDTEPADLDEVVHTDESEPEAGVEGEAETTNPELKPETEPIPPSTQEFTPAPASVPKTTAEEKEQTDMIPAIPPLPSRIPDVVKRIFKWGSAATGAGIAGPFLFLQSNPNLLAPILGFFKWVGIGLAIALAIYAVIHQADKMWKAYLANQLNIARLQNYGDNSTKNIDFKGWKGVPEGEQPKV